MEGNGLTIRMHQSWQERKTCRTEGNNDANGTSDGSFERGGRDESDRKEITRNEWVVVEIKPKRVSES